MRTNLHAHWVRFSINWREDFGPLTTDHRAIPNPETGQRHRTVDLNTYEQLGSHYRNDRKSVNKPTDECCSRCGCDGKI
jgi:hypothetical protein